MRCAASAWPRSGRSGSALSARSPCCAASSTRRASTATARMAPASRVGSGAWGERPGLRVLLYARVDAAGSLFPVGGGDQSPQPLCGRGTPGRWGGRTGSARSTQLEPARRPIGLRGARRRGERDPREGRAGLSPRRGSRSPRRARHRQARGVSGRRSDAGSRRPPRNARAAPAKPGRGSSVSTPTVPWPPTSLLSTTASSRVSAAHGRVGRRRSRRP